jgi:hypothetical protein
LYYAILSFCTISMHIMLGTCVSNLRGRGWVEHSQMHLALKKGTKKFHYMSKSWGILVISIFHETKIQLIDMKVQVYSKFRKIKVEKKWNFQSPWRMEHLTFPSVGASKNGGVVQPFFQKP